MDGAPVGSPACVLAREGTLRANHARIPAWKGFLLLILLFPGAGGCSHFGGTSLRDWWHNGFKVGPQYSKPAAPVAEKWQYVDGELESACESEPTEIIPTVRRDPADYVDWWRVFDDGDDDTLGQLIAIAYQQNLPLRIAGLRVLEARARRGVAAGSLLPQSQRASGDYSRSQTSQDFLPLGANLNSNSWNFGFNLAWELDVWGRFRRSIEAANADLDGATEDYDDVLLTLIADVATTYVQIRTLERRIEIACENVEYQKASVESLNVPVPPGLQAPAAKQVALNQSKSLLAQTKASVPALQSSLRQATNRLSILLGMPPQDLSHLLNNGRGPDGKVRIPSVPATETIAVGIPADLLRRRPDVRAAERAVAAQSARLGVAIADLYPAFELSGNLDWSASDFSDVFRTTSVGGFVNPSFRWRILNYDRLRNNIRGQELALERLAVSYENTVLRAQQETENAMIGFLRSYQRYHLLLEAVQASENASRIAREQNKVLENIGLAGTQQFTLDATVLDNQISLAFAQQDIAENLINLFRALGGGWQIRLDPNYLHGIPDGSLERHETLPQPMQDAPRLPEPPPAVRLPAPADRILS